MMQEDDPEEWKGERVQKALHHPDLYYLPLAWYKYGLVSHNSFSQSGILTNVFEITAAILRSSVRSEKATWRSLDTVRIGPSWDSS